MQEEKKDKMRNVNVVRSVHTKKFKNDFITKLELRKARDVAIVKRRKIKFNSGNIGRSR